ncbi:MAG: LysR family transcriptional regulator [Sphingomonas sp.]|nr:LysR family transcriptional regulator [Sphingomonas sp.]
MTTFIRVVDTGSFSAAARQTNVGQPAVSKLIAQLEDRLGVRLITRTTRGLSPTEAGQRFYERALRALEEADEAELAARGAGRGLTGRLRISAATTFARLHVVPRLPEFLAAHPELDLEVIMDDRVIDMVEEGVDISLRMGELADSTATARKIAAGRRSLVATPAYLARAGVPQTPAEVAGHEAVVYTHYNARNWTFRNAAGGEASVSVGGRLKVTAAEGLRAAVLADIGLAVASEWMFTRELASGAVVRVLEDWALPPIDLWAVFPTGRLASAKARSFADFVAAALREG